MPLRLACACAKVDCSREPDPDAAVGDLPEQRGGRRAVLGLLLERERDHSSYGCTVVSLLESVVASECRTIVAEGVVALLCVLKEADYEDPAFQVSHWGEATYARLLRLKKLYDPDGLFICHHCVGSELWSADGNCRL